MCRSADYQQWPIERRRRSRSASTAKYEAPDCRFDGDTSYRLTYVTPPAAGGGQQASVVRPAQSLQLMGTSDAPFDGRTNYRDEFTAGRNAADAKQPAETAAAQPDDTVVGLVLRY